VRHLGTEPKLAREAVRPRSLPRPSTLSASTAAPTLHRNTKATGLGRTTLNAALGLPRRSRVSISRAHNESCPDPNRSAQQQSSKSLHHPPPLLPTIKDKLLQTQRGLHFVGSGLGSLPSLPQFLRVLWGRHPR